jgi:hypothetical protein
VPMISGIENTLHDEFFLNLGPVARLSARWRHCGSAAMSSNRVAQA